MTPQLLINEPPLQVLPTLAKTIGLNEAIVLQQIHYWLHPQVNKNYFGNRYWVYNTYGQWQKQFPFFSERTLRRTVKNLEASKLLVSCKGGELNQTKFYTINYDFLTGICINPQELVLKEQLSPREERSPELEQSLAYEDMGAFEEVLDIPNQEGDARQQHSSSLSSSIWPAKKEEEGQKSSGVIKSNVIYPTWSKWPDHLVKMATPSGQSGQTIRPNWPYPLAKLTTPTGQIGHLSYTETTTETTSENILPPLLTISQASAREETQEEEKDEETYLEFENASGSLEVAQNQTSDRTIEETQQEIEVKDQTTAEHQFFSELVETWNRTVQVKLGAGQEVRLTDRRKASFNQFLQEVFLSTPPSEKLNAWQDYCILIAKSGYLKGNNSSGFKVTLDWALVPNNAYKVLEGAIYDKPETTKNRFKEQSWEAFSEELARTLPSTPYLQAWLKISVNIAKLIGQLKYKTWFPRVSLKELTETRAVFAVEGDFSRDYIARTFSSEIRCAVQSLYPRVVQIDFQVAPCAGGLA